MDGIFTFWDARKQRLMICNRMRVIDVQDAMFEYVPLMHEDLPASMLLDLGCKASIKSVHTRRCCNKRQVKMILHFWETFSNWIYEGRGCRAGPSDRTDDARRCNAINWNAIVDMGPYIVSLARRSTSPQRFVLCVE